ncbi:uncharacterized protein A4U43_C08F34190 [Asparagus officinalis]|uniref:uncharacterized protein LOC109820515 n=1 Tax=Asparagus officinalis TaxID=4686 RepID=UPI00098E3373|nr:uncharacterized protein LOC109820515 [Asparagus officinalis]ONK61846.1 uncharacterized protein A4U43_C08F34190 [Asparagus officinalis]
MASQISDQKKRALDALERRFAFDKAKIVQQEEKMSKKIRTNPKDEQEVVVADSQKGDNPPSASSSSRKGQVVFSGHTPRQETSGVREDAHPAYSEILEIIDENILGTATKDSNRGDAVNKIVFDLLQHGDKGHKYTKGSIAMKIDNWVLLDNFVPKDSSLKDARVKALQSHSKRSKKHMTMRQHRKCGSLDLLKEFHNFSLFKPMHEMWKEYIIKILKNREKQLAQTLLVADLHGAFLAVVECKTIAFKGISGIMIRETAKTFGLITQDNLFRVVPKQGSVFIFQAGCWKITLHGDNLSLRNSTR